MQRVTVTANGARFDALTAGDGPTVICLHGFPDHNRTWRFLLPALASAGFRGIAPLIRGYQPESQTVDGRYPTVRMARDVLGWIDQLEVERVHLVGHDWGAGIGYLAGALAPNRFKSLCTLTVPHPSGPGLLLKAPSQLLKSWYMMFFQLPHLPERFLSDGSLVRKLWSDWSPGWRLPEDEMQQLLRTLSQPGVISAALGYYRAFHRELRSAEGRETLRLLGKPIAVPTLAINGADDGCIDPRVYDGIDRSLFPRGIRIERVTGAGHFLHQEMPELLNTMIINWIRQHEK